jgi:NADPH:quinone reductase-like Zn-dependent oxidoreductase
MESMKAAIITKFGSEDEFVIAHIPVPQIDDGQVLIQAAYAGIGIWDIFEREGGYAEMMGGETHFPYVLGSEGSGVVVSTGKDVTRFKVGDKVMAAGFLNPKGGFYAEYVAVDEETVSHIPDRYDLREASVILGVGITALRGLIDVLNLQPNEKICIFGASGGIGHIAVQIARNMGAEVCAIASRDDGVELMKQYGIGSVLDGHDEGLAAKLHAMQPGGFDKVLLTASNVNLEALYPQIRHDGKIAFPSGVFPEPQTENGIVVEKFNGEPERDIIERLVGVIEKHPIKPHVDRIFSLEEIFSAHRAVTAHHLGKISLKVSESIGA